MRKTRSGGAALFAGITGAFTMAGGSAAKAEETRARAARSAPALRLGTEGNRKCISADIITPGACRPIHRDLGLSSPASGVPEGESPLSLPHISGLDQGVVTQSIGT